MTEDAISKFIDSVPFFKEFTEHEKTKLVSRGKCFEKYGNAEVIFEQGDAGDSLFLVLSGTITLTRLSSVKTVGEGRISLQKELEKHVTELLAGAIFGEVSMLTDCRRNVTARVNSPTAVVMRITKKLMESLNHVAQIKFHKQLLLSLARHLDEMNRQYIDLENKYNGASLADLDAKSENE